MHREDGSHLEPTLPPVTSAIPIVADDLMERATDPHSLD